MFQPTIKNFKINFNALNQLSTFTRGDLMTGQISFELTKETKIASITMTVRGKAKVDWVSSEGGRKKRGSPQNAKLDLLELKSVILQGDNGMRLDACQFCNSEWMLSEITQFMFPLQLFVGHQNFSLARMCIRFHVRFHMGVYEHVAFWMWFCFCCCSVVHGVR